MYSRFNPKELKELEDLKNSLIENCKDKCDGFGKNEKKCKCFKLFVYLKELYYSKIPKEYWLLTLKDLKVDNIYKNYALK